MTIFFCFIFQSKKIEKKNMSSPSDVSPSSLSNIQPIINVPKSKDNHCELDDHLKNILNEHVFAHENYIINDSFFIDIIKDIRDSVLSTDNEKSVLFYDVNDNDYQSIFVDTNKLHNKFSGFDIFDMNPEFLVNTVVPFLLKEVAAFLNANKSNLATESALIFADRINYENEFKNQSTIVKIQRLSNLMKDIYTNGMIDPTDNHTVHLMIYTRNSNNDKSSSSQIVFWNPFLIKYTEYLLNTSLGKGPANDVIYILQNVFNTTSPRIMEKHSFIRYIMQTLSTNNKTGVVVMNEANKLFIYNLLNISPVQQNEYKNMQEMSRTIDRIKREKGYNTLVEIWTESRSLKKVENFLENTLPRLDSIVDQIFNVGLSSFVNLNKVGVNFFVINESYFKYLAFGFDENDLLIKKYDRDNELKNLMKNLIDDEEEETFVYNTSSVYKLFNMKQLIGDINAQLQNAYDKLQSAKNALLQKNTEYDTLINALEKLNRDATAAVNRLNLEKTELQALLNNNETQRLQLGNKITELNQKITEDTQLTNQQKILYEQQKDKCENDMKDLSLENNDTKQKLLEINTKMIKMQKELDEAKNAKDKFAEQLEKLLLENDTSVTDINDLKNKLARMKLDLDLKTNDNNQLLQDKIDLNKSIAKLTKDLIEERSKSANLTEEIEKLKKPYIGSVVVNPPQPITPEKLQITKADGDKMIEYNNEYNTKIGEVKKKLPNNKVAFDKPYIETKSRPTREYIANVIELLEKYRNFDTNNRENVQYKSLTDDKGDKRQIMPRQDYVSMLTPIYSSPDLTKLLEYAKKKNILSDLITKFSKISLDQNWRNYIAHETSAKTAIYEELAALKALNNILLTRAVSDIKLDDWNILFNKDPNAVSSNSSSSNNINSSSIDNMIPTETTTTNTTTITNSAISTLSMSKVATTPTPTGDTIFTPAKSVVSTLFSWDDWN